LVSARRRDARATNKGGCAAKVGGDSLQLVESYGPERAPPSISRGAAAPLRSGSRNGFREEGGDANPTAAEKSSILRCTHFVFWPIHSFFGRFVPVSRKSRCAPGVSLL
jgi:hypothetical protein